MTGKDVVIEQLKRENRKLESSIDELANRVIYQNDIIASLQKPVQQKEVRRIKVKLDEGAYLPERAHEQDAGYDLRSRETKYIYHGDCCMFDTGVHIEIPEGYVGLVTSKSGLMAKGLTSRGTIDPGYTGSIKVVLYNQGGSYLVEAGDKISQIVFIATETPELSVVKELSSSIRGDNGFGSTGK